LVNYNRIHTNDLGVFKIKKEGRTKVHEVLAELSSTYLYEFLEDDVLNKNLPDPDSDDNIVVSLEFEPHCLGYYSGAKIHTPDSLVVGNAEKARIDKVAKISQAYSSLQVAIFNNATWSMSALGKIVRSDMVIGVGKHYWEITKIARDSYIGIGSRTMSMDQSSGVGSTTNSWALDTSTGKLINSGVAVDFVRPINDRETIGFMLDTVAGTFSVILSDGIVTKPISIGSTEFVVMACGIDNTRSTLKYNLGQDPMELTVPAGAKHGIYTLIPDGA
jgi:hypothetical protein